jgi:hypothetical protein
VSIPESGVTTGQKVVVNRPLVGVVWTIEGILRRGMMVSRHFQHCTTGSPLQAAMCRWRWQCLVSRRRCGNSGLHSRAL